MTAPDPRFAEPACLFWGLGAEKAGTTWLHAYLASHPQVKVPGVFKEQQYWSGLHLPGGDMFRPKTFPERVRIALLPMVKRDARTREWAARQRAVTAARPDHRDHATALLAGWRGERAVGEISPPYALLPASVLAEMASLSPRARFFFVMRDPVDRAVSAARMYARIGGEGMDAEALLERALSGEDTRLLDQSDYARTLAALDAAGVTERTHVLFYETMFAQGQMDRLCAFLGVDPHPAATEDVVFSFNDRGLEIPDPLLARLRERLAPVYVAVRARFGTGVPGAWRA